MSGVFGEDAIRFAAAMDVRHTSSTEAAFLYGRLHALEEAGAASRNGTSTRRGRRPAGSGSTAGSAETPGRRASHRDHDPSASVGCGSSVAGVTALRQLASPTGLRPGDHVFWTFDDPSDFSAAVVPYLDEGRRLGEQLLLTGTSRAALLDGLAGLPERDQMLASGQLEVRLMTDIVDPARGLEPVEQMESYRRRWRPRSGVVAPVCGWPQTSPRWPNAVPSTVGSCTSTSDWPTG